LLRNTLHTKIISRMVDGDVYTTLSILKQERERERERKGKNVGEGEKWRKKRGKKRGGEIERGRQKEEMV
jgi:hypothetical protein